jgi:hypothetical protein
MPDAPRTRHLAQEAWLDRLRAPQIGPSWPDCKFTRLSRTDRTEYPAKYPAIMARCSTRAPFRRSVEATRIGYQSWVSATNGAPFVCGRWELDREDRSSPSRLATLPPSGRRERSWGVLKNDAESGSQLAPYADLVSSEDELAA